MTVEEKLAKKKNELNEKRENLKKVLNESRAIAANDNATSDQLKEAADTVMQAQKDVQTLAADIDNLSKILAGEDTTGETQANQQQEKNDDGEDTDPDLLLPEDEPETDSKRENKPQTENRDGLNVVTNHISGKKLHEGKEERMTEEKAKEVRAFDAYVKSHGTERRAGFNSTSGEAVVPTQILNLVQLPENPNDLSKYVNKQKVSAPAGTLPVSPRATDVAVTVEELAENPELNAAINGIDYKLVTYRGVIPTSEEIFEDSAIDLGGFLSTRVQRIRFNTEQKQIAGVLKTAGAATATSLDDIKDIFNKSIPVAYNKSFVVSQQAFAELDKIKDSQGRYLLQDSVASASGKILLGKPVYLVDDNLFADYTDGSPVAGTELRLFVGDLKAFVLEAYKADTTVKWIDNDIYGQKLAMFFRADFKKAADEAGKFVTLNFSSAN